MCGTYFVVGVSHSGVGARFCSALCGKQASKARRRALQRDAFVEPVSPRRVFERDRWTCRLCGKRVQRDAKVPHPQAPVLDHIVPLAAGRDNGGVHASWNVQCAHFLCNSVKSANYSQGALF